ncbi:hypothetical protein LCGC14_0389310 [marine sediment metagenome]|uniref:Uncharacterized protein n=1 Tax=marine sediment metagenome TaxID=412755 RepID=A0A0F9T5P7_9ZZZZ
MGLVYLVGFLVLFAAALFLLLAPIIFILGGDN